MLPRTASQADNFADRYRYLSWQLQIQSDPAAITAVIAARKGHPALMVTVLTTTIVLFNSNDGDLSLMADKRLLACAIGIAISLGVMALDCSTREISKPVTGGCPRSPVRPLRSS